MIRYILFTFLLVLLLGCSSKMMEPISKDTHSNKKAFEQEDALIMFALRAEQLGDYKSAALLYDTLYKKSNKDEYFHKSLQNNLLQNKFQEVISMVDERAKGKDKRDFFAERFKVLSFIGLQKYDEAKTHGVILVKETQDVNDYILVSDIYVQLQEYDTAVKYLEGAYVKEYNEKLLDKISIILYVNLQKQKEAIAQLETHSRIHGCSELICNRLIGFYSNDNNIEGLLSTQLRLYELKKTEELAKKIVQIYAYKKDYIGMMNFLESSKSDDKTLLELYVNTKNYSKAYQLAQEIYLQTNELRYLAQSAIYEYEGHMDKNDEYMLEKVIKKLEDVVDSSSSSLYMNYLGYLLIDHEINIEEGMKYVSDALALEPNSIYYLDSLAWGYYKLGECKKAKFVMDKVVKMEGADNAEVISHAKLIDKCTKN